MSVQHLPAATRAFAIVVAIALVAAALGPLVYTAAQVAA